MSLFLIVSDDQRFVENWSAVLRIYCSREDHTETCVRLKDALGASERRRPLLVVVDLSQKGRDALAANGDLAALARRTRLLLARESFSTDDEIAALALGVAGCCSGQLVRGELEKIVDVVLKGGVWISRDALPEMLNFLRQAASRSTLPAANNKLGALTPREREIAIYVAEGAANKVIAKRLGLSDLTIKAHLTVIFRKLGVASRVQLALLLSELRQTELA